MDVLGVVQFGRDNLNHARRHLFESSKMIRRIFVDNTILLLERTGLKPKRGGGEINTVEKWASYGL